MLDFIIAGGDISRNAIIVNQHRTGSHELGFSLKNGKYEMTTVTLQVAKLEEVKRRVAATRATALVPLPKKASNNPVAMRSAMASPPKQS